MKLLTILFPWLDDAVAEADKPKPRVFIIPQEHMANILGLSDAFDESNGSKVAYYELWKAIAELYPPVSEGSWRLVFDSAISASVVENVDRP